MKFNQTIFMKFSITIFDKLSLGRHKCFLWQQHVYVHVDFWFVSVFYQQQSTSCTISKPANCKPCDRCKWQPVQAWHWKWNPVCLRWYPATIYDQWQWEPRVQCRGCERTDVSYSMAAVSTSPGMIPKHHETLSMSFPLFKIKFLIWVFIIECFKRWVKFFFF